jgi:hypothetical protein
MAKKIIQIAFTDSDVREHTPYITNQNHYYHRKIVLIDNYEFETKLTYDGFTQGRSTFNIKWIDLDGTILYSGMSLLNNALLGDTKQKLNKAKGKTTLTGTFTFAKRGTVILLIESKIK